MATVIYTLFDILAICALIGADMLAAFIRSPGFSVGHTFTFLVLALPLFAVHKSLQRVSRSGN